MNLRLELTEQEVNLVLQSLAKQPFEVVAHVIAEIQNQYQKSKEIQQDDTN